MLKALFVGLLLTTLSALSGCERDGAAERAGETIDEAVDDAREGAENVREEAEELIEEAGDE